MATCQEIIKRALRLLGVLAAGDEPEAADAADGQIALVAMLTNAVAKSAQPGLTRVLVTDATYTAGEDELIGYDGATSSTITLPTTVEDADTTETRAPKNMAVVMVAGTTPQTFIYDEAYGDWVEVNALALTDYCPLSGMDSEALAAGLAGYLADEYGRQMGPVLASRAARGASWLSGRLRKSVRVNVATVLQRPNRFISIR